MIEISNNNPNKIYAWSLKIMTVKNVFMSNNFCRISTKKKNNYKTKEIWSYLGS